MADRPAPAIADADVRARAAEPALPHLVRRRGAVGGHAAGFDSFTDLDATVGRRDGAA